MIYYAFNDNKPLRFKKEEHQYQIVHYCPHCNTLICGELASESWDENIHNTAIQFANMKICPICQGAFDENRRHHLMCKEYKNYFGSKRNLHHLYDLKVVKQPDLPYELGVDCDERDTLQTGDKILTEFGLVTIEGKTDWWNGVYITYNKYNGTMESVSSILNHYHSEKHNKIAQKMIKTFIYKCTSDDKDATITSFQKNDDFKLKEYLEQLLLIEKNIFSISKRLENLYLLNCTAEKDAFASEKFITLDNAKAVKKALATCDTLKRKNVANEIKITDFPIKYPKEPKKPNKPEEPVLAQPGFFNKKRILAENTVLTEKYEKELEIYNVALEKYNCDFESYKTTKTLLEKQRNDEYNLAIENAKNNLAKEIAKAQAKYDELLLKQQEEENNAKDIPTPEKAKHQFLKEEIEIAEELLKKFYKARNEMYSYGVIFEKYRDFVAVSSFCEYISSGRCETLEGPNGAYNLYENEIRMNTVIEKLNTVIESLEEIKQNQFMIYSAIQESNKYLKTLNSTTTQMLGALGELNEKATTMESYMSKIAYNTKVTAYNTEKTAFYAKKNAELTNALGFMLALK